MARTTKHTMDACLPCGDPDLGADIDLRIVFTFLKGAPEQGPSYASGGQPADPDEVEFVSCVQMVGGKPVVPYGAFADMEQESNDDLARAYLECDEGFAEALEIAASDDEAAREYAAESRADR